MKKKSLLLNCMLLIATLAMIFSACAGSSYSKIKSAYEAKGYTESDKISAYQSQIDAALGDDYESSCTVHLMANGLNVALILEFTSTKRMEEAFENSATLKGLLTDLENQGVTDAIRESDYVNGNCVLLFYTPLSDAKTIFKDA